MNLGMTMAMGVALVWGVACATAVAQPALDHYIETALRVNPDVRSASARLEAARAAVKEATSAYYPQIGLQGSWTRTDNPPQAFFMSLNQRRASLEKDFNHPEDIENARGSIVAQWRVFDSGRREADRRAVKLGVKAADNSLETVHNDLIYQITQAYYTILQVRDFIKVQETSLTSLSENLRVATERFNAGGALKTDVLSLDVQLSQAREELIRAKNGLQLAVASLNTAVGETVLNVAGVAELTDRADMPRRSGQSGERGIDARPEWRMVQARVGMAGALVDRARRDYLPVVNAFGSLDWDTEPFNGAEQSYLAGAAVELNIFDGFRTRAGVARASAEKVAAQAEADKLRKLLELDLTQSRLNEQEARERLEVASKSLANAEEALRITEERFKQGAASVTELLAVQVGLTATRTRQVAARYDGILARANVERAVGALAEEWGHRDNKRMEGK